MKAVSSDLVRHFDHTTAEHTEHLLDRYRFLREQCPVTYSENHGGFWVISRHRDIVDVLQNHRRFTSKEGVTFPSIGNLVPGIPTESDEPLHAQYRRILWPFLTPQAVAGYESFIRRSVIDQIETFIHHGTADVVAQLARPIPPKAMECFFGMTGEEAARAYEWINTMVIESSRDLAKVMEAANAIFAFLGELIERARKDGGSHVIGAAVTAEVDGRPLTETETLGLIFTSIVGALETTVSALSHAVWLLDRFPDVRARLIEQPTLIPAAVEEVLRMESPAQAPARTVAEDVTVSGCPFKAGERVLLLFGSANYDEDVFPQPETFRLDRGDNPHLAFGQGVHKCVGQYLARLEIKIVIEELLRLIPDYEVVGEVKPVMRGGALRGLDTLPIRFTPPAG